MSSFHSLAAIAREAFSWLRDLEKAMATPLPQLDAMQQRYDQLMGEPILEEVLVRENQMLKARIEALKTALDPFAMLIAEHQERGILILGATLEQRNAARAALSEATTPRHWHHHDNDGPGK